MSKKVKNTKVENVEMSEATAPVETEKATKAKGKVAIKDNGFKVKHTLNLNPAHIELVDKFRGRSKPVGGDELVSMAESFRVQGQQQAIQVREKEGEPGKFECVFGNTRKQAADLCVSGYETGKKVVPANPNFLIRAEVVECSDEEAFARNVVENAARVATSPIDDAINQKRLRDEYGMSDVAIAALYGFKSSASCSNLKKLLELDEDCQRMIHDGSMTQQAGLLLAKVDEDLRSRVYFAAVDSGQKEGEGISGAMMAKAIKQINEEVKKEKATQTADKPAGEAASGENTTAPEVSGTRSENNEKSISLTLKGFKDIVQGIASDTAAPAKVAECMGIILDTLAGQTSPEGFANWFLANVKQD